MKSVGLSLVSMLGLWVLVAGCAGPSGGSSEPAVVKRPAGESASAAAGSDLPSIPTNAQWTLYCQVIRTPDHIPRSKQVKEALAKATGMNDWYVVHGDGYSGLYYGFYAAIDDATDRGEASRAQGDRRRIMAYREAGGEMPFQGAVFVPLTEADPPAPAEWDLTRTPETAFWTVQIAAYTGSAERKKAAVDSVRAAREMGIPAYFYHGDNVSSVCIGTWPRAAVREQESSSQYNPDPNKSLLVMDHVIPGLPTDLRDTEGNAITTVAPKVEIADPTLAAALRQYPHHAVNGEQMAHQATDKVTGRVTTTMDPSFLVEIPRGRPSMLGGGAPAAPTPAAPAWNPGAPPPGPDGGGTPGRLRSIGQ